MKDAITLPSLNGHYLVCLLDIAACSLKLNDPETAFEKMEEFNKKVLTDVHFMQTRQDLMSQAGNIFFDAKRAVELKRMNPIKRAYELNPTRTVTLGVLAAGLAGAAALLVIKSK